MRFRHLRGIIIALMATAGLLAVASCTSSEKEPEADFRVGRDDAAGDSPIGRRRGCL